MQVHPLFSLSPEHNQHRFPKPLRGRSHHTRGIPETPRMPNAAPHVCACGGRPLVRTCMRCTDRTLRIGRRNPDRAWEEPSCSSTGPAEIEALMQKPLRLGTSPFSWTCGRGRFGRRPGGRECSAPPRTTQNACLPLSSRMPPLPPLASQPCARSLTRGIPETPRMPNAAPHACACGGRPLVRGRVRRHRGARARDACVPPSVGVTEPTPPRGATPMSRSRLMPPGHRTARCRHTPERDVGPAGLPRSALQSRSMRG